MSSEPWILDQVADEELIHICNKSRNRYNAINIVFDHTIEHN